MGNKNTVTFSDFMGNVLGAVLAIIFLSYIAKYVFAIFYILIKLW